MWLIPCLLKKFYPLGNRLLPIESKAGQTITSSQVEPMEKFARLFPSEGTESLLVYGGNEEVSRGDIHAMPVQALVPRLRRLES